MLALTFALLSAATSVLAHGIVEEMTVGNPAATYTSYLPYTDPYKSPVPERITRKIPGNGPVEDITLSDIQCNTGAEPAALVGEIAAGSTLAFNWTTAWPTSHVGPVITYMARAPSDITQWSPGTDAVWFKIDEAGLEDGKWAATDILIANGGIHTVTIPSTLKAGQYLIRHEIIALHSAGTYPGAQFYPMCAQFEVTGSGTALPDDADLVSFPGAYTPTTPGIAFNVYAGATEYPIPGPAVWNGSGSGTGSGSGSSSTAAAATSTAAAATSEAASSTAVASSTEASATTEVASSTEAAEPTEVASSPAAASSTEAASTEAPEETSAPATSVATSPAGVPTSRGGAPSTSRAAPSTTKAAPSSTSAAAGALATHYAQCGGRNFNGPKGCVSPYVCKDWNDWYSQCVEA